MHDLATIKHLNATRDESGQLPHNESGFDAAGNVDGIQGHSQGPVFPIIEYTIGDSKYVSQAPFAPGCELVANSYDGQRCNSYRLKRLEQLADDICRDAQEGGRSVYVSYVKSGVDIKSGYLVSSPKTRKSYPAHRKYKDIYRHLFENRQHLSDGGVIGAVVQDGQIHLFLLSWTEDLSEAQKIAKSDETNVVWDCRSGLTIFV